MTEATPEMKPEATVQKASTPEAPHETAAEAKPQATAPAKLGATSETKPEKAPIPGMFPLFLAVLLAYMGQMILNPIIAPLSREIGLKEWHIGATISLAAIVLSLSSTSWGRVSLKRGARPILVMGMLGAATALAAFAVVAWFGLQGALAGTALVLGVVFTRGFCYGGSIAAISPAAQTYIITHTYSEAARVKGVGMLGAAQGFASILGALVGGSLAAFGGFMLPLTVMPVMILVGIVLLLATFKPVAGEEKIERPAKVSYFDPRVFAFLACGFLMFTVFSTMTTVFGFLLQDALGLNAGTTAGFTALCMSIMGVVMIIAQAVVAPKLGWSAVQLFRRGLMIFFVALALLLYPVNLGVFIVACVLAGFGSGLAMPGYNTAPTLRMAPHEQGGVAGLINANNGAAYVAAPVVSTALYGVAPWLPIALSVVLLAAGVVLRAVHPAFRRRADS